MSVEIKYYDKEKTRIKYVCYLDKHGSFHRTDGPAFIIFNEDGSVRLCHHFLYGTRLTEAGNYLELDEASKAIIASIKEDICLF